jgi:hypothetical protein
VIGIKPISAVSGHGEQRKNKESEHLLFVPVPKDLALDDRVG